ncbi:MAG: GTPase HflX [Hyphomicrobium sp.]
MSGGGETSVSHSPRDRLLEARGLAEAIDLHGVVTRILKVMRPTPATLLGSGTVAEIKELIEETEANLVVIDHSISPVQQRNLEKTWNVKVLDRTGLILEIFGRRARTKEGCLQVELAHLMYQKGRLVRAWTHLERQRGGASFLGGPGEAQIELDRRMLEQRIEKLKKELAQVVRTRELHREGRRKVPYPIVAIVGYTNAGKSTLFNKITGAGVLAKDQVFATLDPTMREVRLKTGRRIILSDTVGFISNLPTMLVAAFRATLEEVLEADLILHVRDISHAGTKAQAADVENVLRDLGIEPHTSDRPILEVWNKIDLVDQEARPSLEAGLQNKAPPPVIVSALNGEGVDLLLQKIDDLLGSKDEILNLKIPAEAGRLISWLHEQGHVLEKKTDKTGNIKMKVQIASEKRGRLKAQLETYGLGKQGT